MILLYRVITNILYPFLIVYIYFRVLLRKEDPKRFKEKIFLKNFKVKRNKNSKLLWFHAASVGEFKSIIPIINKLNHNKKNYEFLITTNTYSSSQFVANEFKKFKNIHHRFLPLDIVHLINGFIESWKPEKIFLVDSEIWPNLILQANYKKISIALINARLTKKSIKRWLFFPKTANKIFKKFDLCLCSNIETKKFLKQLNLRKIRFEGNIKFIQEASKKIEYTNNLILSKSRIWVAASIHEEEDIYCLKVHKKLKKKYNNIITIIAPRHLNRVKKIRLLSENLGLETQILNRGEKILEGKEVIIINSFGVLQNYYHYAKSVFIGKSTIKKLKNDSGQNPIDAAYQNCKIYHGPYVSNFKEIYEILNINKISRQISDFGELNKNLISDFKNTQKNK